MKGEAIVGFSARLTLNRRVIRRFPKYIKAVSWGDGMRAKKVLMTNNAAEAFPFKKALALDLAQQFRSKTFDLGDGNTVTTGGYLTFITEVER